MKGSVTLDGDDMLCLEEAGILDGALTAATREIYGRDMRYITAWHRLAFGVDLPWPAPEDLFIRFIIDSSNGPRTEVDDQLRARGLKQRHGGVGASVIRRRVAAWRHEHGKRGFLQAGTSVRIERLLRAVKRRSGPPRLTPGISWDELQQACHQCEESRAGRRDRALLLVAFTAGGRRRSELAAIKVEDVALGGTVRGDVKVNVLKRRQGEIRVHLPPMAMEAVREWLAVAELSSGPLFRSIDKQGRVGAGLSPAGIRLIMRRRFAQAGLRGELTAHSVRAGYITEAMVAGVSLGEIMGATGHRSVAACTRYFRPGL